MLISIYLFLFIFGFVMVIVLASLGMLGEVDLNTDAESIESIDEGDTEIYASDENLENEQHSGSISPLSPFMIGLFMSFAGGVGMVMEKTGLDNNLIALSSFSAGFIITYLSRKALTAFFINQQASSIVDNSDILGETGEVTTAIPSDGRVGVVVINSRSGRMDFPARASIDIGCGELVVIKKRIGDVVYVEKADTDEKDISISEKIINKVSQAGELLSANEEKISGTVIYNQRRIEIRDSVVQGNIEMTEDRK